MTRILGIDTGGTYTDGVILELPDGKLIGKVKTPTTHEDLNQCIYRCMQSFEISLRNTLDGICLSTTLATNAVVENSSQTEGLILIGKMPRGEIPAQQIRRIPGELDIMGRVKTPLDAEKTEEAIESLRGHVDAIAVSGYASVRNPQMEIYVKQKIQQILGIPVVCAHELTGELGFYKRTVMADLNARLIPLIYRLISSVKEAMRKLKLDVPLMIVKGDGSIMSDRQALKRPIETVMSGPAASVTGAVYLSGEKEAAVVDMGGTTSDWSRVKAGKAEVVPGGIHIGDWFTGCRAVKVYTVGFGGDIRIHLNRKKKIVLEEERVWPYCKTAAIYPDFKREVLAYSQENFSEPADLFLRELEGFIAVRIPGEADEKEKEIFRRLKECPHTLWWLRRRHFEDDTERLLDRMIKKGMVRRVGLTPTDLLHAQKKYQRWDCETAECIISLYARCLSVSPKACMQEIRRAVDQKIISHGQAALSFFDENPQEEKTDTKLPLIAVGASAGEWSRCLDKRLFQNIIVPLHADAAGAAGAALGNYFEAIDILIRPDHISRTYLVFSRNTRKKFKTLEEATGYAREQGTRELKSILDDKDISVEISCCDLEIEDEGILCGKKEFIERCVRVSVKNPIHPEDMKG